MRGSLFCWVFSGAWVPMLTVVRSAVLKQASSMQQVRQGDTHWLTCMISGVFSASAEQELGAPGQLFFCGCKKLIFEPNTKIRIIYLDVTGL